MDRPVTMKTLLIAAVITFVASVIASVGIANKPEQRLLETMEQLIQKLDAIEVSGVSGDVSVHVGSSDDQLVREVLQNRGEIE